MSVEIRIPTPLRRFTSDLATVHVPASTVAEALERLFTDCPGLKSQIVEETGQVRRFVNLYVNGEDIRFLDGPKTVLISGDQLAIVPAIAGGSAPLTREEIARYSRHLLLPEVAVEGQKRLRDGRVLLVGAGGLGSPAALYLAAAGVGTIGLVEFDVVDESNLQRQILHDTTWIGKPKIESAAARLNALNPFVKVVPFEERLTSQNALRIFEGFDVVVDGTDNFATRYLTNDACYFLKKPNVYGSIFRFEGQASVFWPDKGPCYRCLYPSPPPPGLVPSCAEGGVLGVLPGVIGCLQATEALKILLQVGRSLVGRLLLYDALDLSFRELKLRKDPDCPLCGEKRTVTGLVDYEEFCGIGRGEDTALPAVQEIGPRELKEWLGRGDDIQLLDVREPHEAAICAIEGARLIPLALLPEHLHDLDATKTTVVHCKSGVRSAKAVQLLKQAGLTRTYNLRGGILAWAREVDPSLPTY
jgi:molybdopterin/thiamine biosynthesis adenylyltransferase/rhodanese-related sulfurtransferase/molybdopterin converting factor small subunit